MARFLFASMPIRGHVNPALPIARALVQRGHQVRWYTGRGFRNAIEATGAQLAPIQTGSDPADQRFDGRLPQGRNLAGLPATSSGLRQLFIGESPAQVADLRRILAEFPADIVLSDPAFYGARLLHELGGPPWATYGIAAPLLGRARNPLLSALFSRVLARDAQQRLRQVRQGLGLAPDGPPAPAAPLSPYLYLQGSTQAFEHPRGDLAPQVHFIGPLLPATPPDFAPPPWWPELYAGRPVVLVSQGAGAADAHDLILPALQALADEDLLVVATTGEVSAQELARMWASASEAAALAAETRALIDVGLMGGFGPMHIPSARYRPQMLVSAGPETFPANARVARFIPFAALLPHVDVMVSSGGYGGVQFALAHGVPLVVAGASEEQPDVAASVAWSGAGINLKTKAPARRQIRAAVRALLTDPSYRQHAERIRDDYAQHKAPDEAAALLERLAATRRPVLRDGATAGAAPRAGAAGGEVALRPSSPGGDLDAIR